METRQFVREATGLVREFGATETLLLASVMVFALVYTTTQFPWFYGNTLGANLPASLLVAAIPFAFLMLAYWAIGLVMPRSGSDYVWVGRIFHPAIGFAWALLYMFTVFFVAYVGEIAAFSFAISAALTTLGLTSSSASLTSLGSFLGSQIGTFYLAILFTVVFGLFSIFGSKLIKGLLYVTWVFAIVGMLLMWYILGTTSQSTYVSNWNTMLSSLGSNATYAAVEQSATAGGNFPGTATGFGAILMALPFASLFLFGGNYANAFAGEIKNVRRSIPIALFLSLVFGVIYWTITSTLTLNTVGSGWMAEVGHAWATGSGYNLPFPPTQPLMLAVAAYPNNLLTTFMFITYIIGSLGALFAYFWIPSKYFFAWSFDRVIPSKFADVNQRFHTPYLAILAIVVLAIVLSWVYSFLGWSSAFTLGTVIWGVSYVIPGLALMVFPYVKKDLFAQSPGWVGKKVAGIPIVSIVGLITAAGFAWIGYIAYSNPAITAPNQFSFILTTGIVILALVIFFVSRRYHKSKGMDLSLALKEIPPE